jgi:hypothetical protein
MIFDLGIKQDIMMIALIWMHMKTTNSSSHKVTKAYYVCASGITIYRAPHVSLQLML